MKNRIKFIGIIISVLITVLLIVTAIVQNFMFKIINFGATQTEKEAMNYDIRDGNVQYGITDNALGGYTITSMGGYDSNYYIVPSNIQGYNINVLSSIENNLAYSSADITELGVPASINFVTSGVFNKTALQNVQTVNYNVINFNEQGYDIDPNPLTNATYSLFGAARASGLDPVKTINVGNGVKIIPASFASYARKLTKVNISNTVTEIRDYAFMRCSALEELDIPSSVTKIGQAVFQGSGLKSLYIPPTVTSIGSDNFVFMKSGFVIKCLDGSYALQYAKDNNISYEVLESAPIKFLSVDTYPTKTEYTQYGESLDLSGGYLNVTYSDGTTQVISMTDPRVSVTGFDNTTVGTKDLVISYGGKSVDWFVDIIPRTLYSISVKTTPNKTTYIQNYETLDLTGGKITLTYNNNTTEEKNMTDAGVSVTGFSNRILGKNTITVTYEGETTTFDVEIVAKSLNGINVKTKPNKTTYIQNYETLDLTGGKITLTYNDNTTEEKNMSDSGVSITGFNNGTIGKNTVTVTYGGKTATFDVEIVAKTLTGISIKTNPTKTTYKQKTDGLDLTGGKILLTYNDNTTEEKNMTDSGVEVKGFDNTKLGKQTITVTYGEKTATFEVEVIEDQTIELGDINGDGKVNSTDLLLLKRHIVAGSRTEWKLVGNKFTAGDMNKNLKIDATDLLLLKRKLVNKVGE